MALPGPFGTGDMFAWRLDGALHAETWDSGEGAFQAGGRWNGRGVRAVYCALDPATAILEVAVHKGFEILDTMPHVLTCIRLLDVARVEVVTPDDVPDPVWLRPGTPGAAQQAFGSALLARHAMVAIPSAVSPHSWNLVFTAARAAGAYEVALQERFALDPRLNPARGI